MKDVLGNILRDRSFRLVHWLSITLFLRKTNQESINLERKSYLDCSSDTHCTRENLEGWRTGCRPWGVGDDRRIRNLLKKTQCERGDISQENGKFMFPVADGRIKPLGGDQDLRTSTLTRQRPIRGESHLDFLGESEGSLPPPQDSLPDAGEAINDFWSMSGNFIYRHLVEPRVNSPREESFLFHWITLTSPELHIQIWMSSKWNASMIIGTSMGQEICLILGQVSLNLIYWKKKPPNGFLWSGGRLTRKQLTSRPDHLWPELWDKMGKNAKLKEKQKWSHEKLILKTHENCEGSISLTRKTRNSRRLLRMLVRNWKHRLLLLCNAKSWRAIRIVGVAHPTKSKTKLACILEASESTRLRMGETLPTHHEDHIAGRGNNSLQHYNLVHKFIPTLQAMKILASKAAVDKEWEKLEKIGVEPDESQK